MKIVKMSIFAFVVFSRMQMKKQDVYSVKCTPIQDTLLDEMDNLLTVLKNDTIDNYFDGVVTISGASLTSTESKGKFIAYVPHRKIGNAEFSIFVKNKIVFEKTFVTRPK